MKVVFPDVKVAIGGKGSSDILYLGRLGIREEGLAESLAYAIAEPIETTQRFVGATIGEYAGMARRHRQELVQTPDGTFLRALLENFTAWGADVYGIVLDEGARGVQQVLRNKGQMEDFLARRDQLGTFEGWDAGRLSRTVFVPSERFTSSVWEFRYRSLSDLQKVEPL